MRPLFNDLRIEILKNFPTQSDFAESIGIHESLVSQILRGRRKLSPMQAEVWMEALKCDRRTLEPVILQNESIE